MKHLIVGTAGHIDHGKSALVKALTGTDPDRLPEEQERGITIELGFAHLELPDDLRLAFVDVPGHERFVKNMLAGAGGVDMVLLVVAADESVMPQTREHFQICRLLGATWGVIALTKTDLADPDLVELARLEVEEMIEGSFLEGAPIVPVSSVTGEGIPDVQDALRLVAEEVEERGHDGPFRLPVDRVFTLRGFGTVVTGTAISGSVRTGDEVEVLPGGLRVRVRGVQVHGKSQEVGAAGERVALNLQSVTTEELDRGNWLASTGLFPSVQMLDARIEVLADAPAPIKDMARVRFHLGAAEVLGRVRLLEPAPVAPGASGRVQIRLERPVHALCGERFVLRRYSPVTTVAGGIVLDPAPPKRTRLDPEAEAHLAELESGEPERMLRAWTLAAGRDGFPLTEAPGRTGWTPEALQGFVRAGEESGEVVLAAERLVPGGLWKELLAAAEKRLVAYHEKEPLSPGMGLEELRNHVGLGDELFRALVECGEKAGRLRRKGDRVTAAGHEVSLSGEEERIRDAIVAAFREGGMQPPSEEEVLKAHPGGAGPKLLRLLLADGTLVRIRGGLLYHREPLEWLVETVRTGPSPFQVPAFKERTGTTRKHAIPLLEWLDEKGITRRVGDSRQVVARLLGKE